MELRHLRYFIALADDPNLAQAAKHCGLTGSVLSKHINDLEDSLGCSLFRRHGGQYTLSAAGQVFLNRAKDILASAAAAAGEVRAAAAAAASQLRIGHYGRWWMRRYEPALRHFTRDNPGIKLHPVELLPADIVGCLRRGEVDMALLESVDVALRIDFKVRRIEAVTAQIVMPKDHPLARRKRVAFRSLVEEAWISWDERGYPGRSHLLLDAAEAAGFRPCIAHDADSELSMYDLVANGAGIGYIGFPPVEAMPDGVKLVPLSSAVIEFPVYLAWRKDSENIEQLEHLGEELLEAGRG